jgi:hypothetical protein
MNVNGMLTQYEGYNFGFEIKNTTNDKCLFFIARFLLHFWAQCSDDKRYDKSKIAGYGKKMV